MINHRAENLFARRLTAVCTSFAKPIPQYWPFSPPRKGPFPKELRSDSPLFAIRLNSLVYQSYSRIYRLSAVNRMDVHQLNATGAGVLCASSSAQTLIRKQMASCSARTVNPQKFNARKGLRLKLLIDCVSPAMRSCIPQRVVLPNPIRQEGKHYVS